MSLAYIVKFRINRANYERLLQESKSLGYGTISDYLRHRLLGPAMFIETTLKENNLLLRKICTQLRIKTKE
jgi:hypothetical protein